MIDALHIDSTSLNHIGTVMISSVFLAVPETHQINC